MKIKIKNRKNFIDNFIVPISKIKSSAVIQVTPTEIKSFNNTQDRAVALFSSYKQDNEGEINLNVRDVNIVQRMFQMVEADDLEFTVEKNKLTYNSDEIKFKHYLLNNGAINAISMDASKLDEKTYDVEFEIDNTTLQKLLKGSAFTNNSEKIYIFSKGNCVYGELNDLTKPNQDTFTYKLAENYHGDFTENLAIPFYLCQWLTNTKIDKARVQISKKPHMTLVFTLQHDNLTLKYASRVFVK